MAGLPSASEVDVGEIRTGKHLWCDWQFGCAGAYPIGWVQWNLSKLGRL